jgi:hypothetical protein
MVAENATAHRANRAHRRSDYGVSSEDGRRNSTSKTPEGVPDGAAENATHNSGLRAAYGVSAKVTNKRRPKGNKRRERSSAVRGVASGLWAEGGLLVDQAPCREVRPQDVAGDGAQPCAAVREVRVFEQYAGERSSETTSKAAGEASADSTDDAFKAAIVVGAAPVADVRRAERQHRKQRRRVVSVHAENDLVKKAISRSLLNAPRRGCLAERVPQGAGARERGEKGGVAAAGSKKRLRLGKARKLRARHRAADVARNIHQHVRKDVLDVFGVVETKTVSERGSQVPANMAPANAADGSESGPERSARLPVSVRSRTGFPSHPPSFGGGAKTLGRASPYCIEA